MAYRTVTINGVHYEYVVGKKNTKVKGVSVFDNEVIGADIPQTCECCGESLNSIHGSTEYVKTGVTPGCVIRAIKSKLEQV